MTIRDGLHRATMVTVKFSDATMTLIRANAIGDLKQNAVKVDGWWETPISRDVLSGIVAASLDGESLDDTVLRLLSNLSAGAH